jgi:coronin-1B/1C/6
VVLDTDWNPFNDSLIASGSDDGKVFLWRVPDNFSLRLDIPADEISDVAPVGKLNGHPRKVGHVLFNPAAENVLASASGDFTVKLWDIESGSAKLSLKVGEVIQSMDWSANGGLLVTTSRDKKLRIWDTRQEKPAQEVAGHQGAKNSRAVWMGEHDRIATTGFSRMSDRQLALWDIKAPNQPVDGFQMLDSISGVCMPFWDDGTNCLYLAGKGDGNIRYYEYENDKFEYLSEYKSSDPQRGVAFLPKRGVNMHENEVMRAYKTVNDSYIEPISFIVPRRAESFQEDIYPPCFGLKPAMSAKEWFEGAEGVPPKISLESIFDGTGVKEASPDEIKKSAPAPAPEPAKPEPKKEVEPPQPGPSAIASRGPPPSMKEQGSSMMAMANKFEDKEPVEEEESDFEEVEKPVERTSAVRPASSQVSPAEAAAPTSELWKKDSPVEKEPGSAKVSYTDSHCILSLYTDIFQPSLASPPLPTASTNADGNALEAEPSSDFPTSSTSTAATGGSNEVLEREIKNMKTMMAQQTRQLASLTKTVQDLAAQVKSMKS